MATMAASPMAGVARAARLAQYRAESSYAGGLADGVAVARLLAEQSASRATFLGALGEVAKMARAQMRKAPSGYWVGKLDALADARRG